MSKIFVSGIGTDVGKTLVSAILTQALGADYWKPVQAGSLDATDTDMLRKYCSNTLIRIHPEAFRLKHACSPHLAAALEGRRIEIADMPVPATSNTLVIEGAGGLLTPLNNNAMMVDLIAHWQLPTVLVSRHYLGSINHTLMSVEILKQRGLRVLGLVFNGGQDQETEKFILRYTGLPCLLRIEQETLIDQGIIKKYAESLEWNDE